MAQLKYGLNIAARKAPTPQAKTTLSAFNDDDEDVHGGDVNAMIRREAVKTTTTRKVTKEEGILSRACTLWTHSRFYLLTLPSWRCSPKVRDDLKKAMAEDPSVFAYDEVYDDMRAAKQAVDPRVGASNAAQARKPKYMEALMRAAREREMESKLVDERKVSSRWIKKGQRRGITEVPRRTAWKRFWKAPH